MEKSTGKFSSLSRTNLEYLEQQFVNYQKDPESVEQDWRLFFDGVEFAQHLDSTTSVSSQELNVYNLIQYYRDYGHLIADIDPLKIRPRPVENFDIKNFNLNKKDLNKKFSIGSLVGKKDATLQEIIDLLQKSYSQKIAAHVSDCESQVRDWFHQKFERGLLEFHLNTEQKKQILTSLIRTESLEKFIHTRYVGQKRFSIEGADALLPMLEKFIHYGTALGMKESVIGMAHRGRINVLANFMGKALKVTFAEFDGILEPDENYDGDVKYHMGYSADKETPNGNCHISLAFNPSHLQAVAPVALGMVRAKQRRHKDTKKRETVVPVIIHGDAAFTGQGVTSETLQLSQLEGYTVGGSIHIITNNQVGFTTNPHDSRSTRYSSDMAKSIKAPVILVNGDDAEACVRAMHIATDFRQKFKQDIVIDLICYRRYGHNEGDEPSFTQPQMYAKIKKHPTLKTIYTNQLIQESVITAEYAKKLYDEKINNLQTLLEETRATPPKHENTAFEGLWKGLRPSNLEDFETPVDTTCKKADLKNVADTLTTAPSEINIHPKVNKLIETRKKMIDEGRIDWGLAELLCYGSLLKEGTSIRLSGQDCQRGTFSHRHAVYFDKDTAQPHCPLTTINSNNSEFCIYNSPLSEMAVLGFEYGNTISDPTFLTIWEAQFGDFANGAQIIIDQFLSSGEQKWTRMTGLTLLLPHGYEGQGPEHSSARLERFLQLCAQNNMQICNLTTPANLFHGLRRQVRRNFRKPLIIMSPKSLLRHPKVITDMDELATGEFHEVIADPKNPDPHKVETVVLCSGKLYYDLDEARKKKKSDKLTLIRIEQLYPFPKTQITPYLNGFTKLKRVIWAQEEPQNMGSYQFIAPLLRELLDDLGLKKIGFQYAGRTHRASPATGSPKQHIAEQKQIIDQCMNHN